MLEFEVGKPLPKSESYDQRFRARGFWRRAFWSGDDFKRGQDSTGVVKALPAHERETDEKYKRRLSQAKPGRYTRSIIKRYNDHANRGFVKRPEAPDGGPYGQFLKDATGSGTSFARLIRRAMLWAQVEQSCYLLADSNIEGVFMSAAQEAAAGKRSIVRLVRADQVTWWKDWDGQVDSALILFVDRMGNSFAWYVTPEFTQRIDYESLQTGDTKVMAIGPQTAHGYQGCPLVRLAPEWDDCDFNPSESQAAPIAESQARIMNEDSWLMEEIQNATFTTPVFLGTTKEQVSEVIVGPGKGLAVPGAEGKTPSIAKLGADPAQADSIRKTIELEIVEMYRCAGLSPGNPTEAGQPVSGVAQAFKFNEVEATLAALADAAEQCENLTVRRAAAGGGYAYPGDCDWPDTFAAPDLAAELEYTIRIVTATLPGVLKSAAISDFAGKGFKNLSPDQKKQLAEELEQMQEETIADEMDGDDESTPRLVG